MKYLAFLSVLVIGLANSQAGGFGGPPPFTNGSPLLSGVDGTYQASVRGNNMSGVIKFTYSSGVQTTSTAGNTWMIFFEGQVYMGTTNVAINNGNLAGVLDTSFDTPVTITNSSQSTTSAGTVSSSTSVQAMSNPSGFFNGSIDNNSPNGAFRGKGELSYVERTTSSQSDSAAGTSSSSTTTATVSENFKLKGVRVTFGS